MYSLSINVSVFYLHILLIYGIYFDINLKKIYLNYSSSRYISKIVQFYYYFQINKCYHIILLHLTILLHHTILYIFLLYTREEND